MLIRVVRTVGSGRATPLNLPTALRVRHHHHRHRHRHRHRHHHPNENPPPPVGSFPAHPAGSFHYPSLTRLPILAQYSVIKVNKIDNIQHTNLLFIN